MYNVGHKYGTRQGCEKFKLGGPKNCDIRNIGE